MRNLKHKAWCGCALDAACGDGCDHCICLRPLPDLQKMAKELSRVLDEADLARRVGRPSSIWEER